MECNHISINQQSSIRIQGSQVIYFDPFEIKEVSEDADVIFVTHEHSDHFDPVSIQKIRKEDTILIAPETMKSKVEAEAGIPDEKLIFVKPGERLVVADIVVEVCPAYNHMKPFHPKKNHWVGYKATMDQTSYYVAGDTDAIAVLREITCDVALLPIGGLFTMDKKQAAELTIAISPKMVIPTHYGSIVGKSTDGQDFRNLVRQKNPDIEVELKL